MKCFVCVFFTFFAVTGFAQALLKFSAEESKVSFEAEATPGFLKISGEGGKIEGSLKVKKDKVTGELTVKLEDFKTGIDLRDEHMKDKYLEVKKYPVAKLKIEEASALDGEHSFKGKLTLHGKTKPIEGAYTLRTDGKKKTVRASFSFDVTSYGIDVPTYQVLTVAKDVKVTVDAVAQ